MPTRNINLTGHLDQFIEERVTSGRFGNASEVVREGLRLLEQRDKEEAARVEWLRGAVSTGMARIDRGEGIEFQSAAELVGHVRRIGAEVLKRPAPKPRRA